MTNFRKLIVAALAISVVSVSWLGTAQAGFSLTHGLSVSTPLGGFKTVDGIQFP
jgi:hypothetical protein